MRIEHRDLAGVLHVTDDGMPDPVFPTDPAVEIAALKAEVATLRAATVAIAQQAAPLSKTAAEALVSKVAATKT